MRGLATPHPTLEAADDAQRRAAKDHGGVVLGYRGHRARRLRARQTQRTRTYGWLPALNAVADASPAPLDKPLV
jgi:hypothetical protein